MSSAGKVTIWLASNPKMIVEQHTTYESMKETLAKRGIGYERWIANKPLSINATSNEILNAYKTDINRIMKEHNFVKCDVLQVKPNDDNIKSKRKVFLDEHTHNEKEVRFFVDGAAQFYINNEINNEVIGIEGTKGHLLVVPEKAKHWFDMGKSPFFRVIRFFATENGWQAKYTGNQIAKLFPKYKNNLNFKAKL